jgi:uncharacterized protein YjbI with pentapeptide repeats
MYSRLPRWAAFTAVSAISLVSVLPQSAAAQTLAPAATAPSCNLNPSFTPLVQGTPNVIGDCLDNGSINPSNGNVEQHTTGGLVYWRQSDSATIFTDGNRMWLYGPFGVQSRLNSDPQFDWEFSTQVLPDRLDPPTGPVWAPGADWSNSDRRGQDLHGSTLSNGKFVKVDFSGANLSGADMSLADSKSAIFARTDLHDSNLYNANFLEADFSGANLSGAYMNLTDVTRAVFAQADLTRVQLSGATSSGNQGPNFFQAHLNNAKLNNAKLPFADFRQADLRNADLSRSSLVGADLRNADLRGADLSQVDFSKANLSGGNLTGATIVGAKWTNSIKLNCGGCGL